QANETSRSTGVLDEWAACPDIGQVAVVSCDNPAPVPGRRHVHTRDGSVHASGSPFARLSAPASVRAGLGGSCYCSCLGCARSLRSGASAAWYSALASSLPTSCSIASATC